MNKNVVDKKRIAKNTILLYFRMIVLMLVTLYTSRVVLDVLGVKDFGVYNVVAGVVALFGFFNSAMTMATQRFLNIELGKGNQNELNRVFSMAMNIHILIGLIIVIFAETFGLWFLNNSLNIPEDRMNAANLVFQFVIINVFINIVLVPYNSVILSREKMGIYAYFSIVEAILKLLLVFILFYIKYDKLILYSVLMCSVSLIVFFMYYFYSSKKFKEAHYVLFWDKILFKEISGFLGWNICGQISQMFTTQGVNMVANIFYGVTINAALAITNQVNGAISMFVNNFQTSFRPQIMKSYAANELKSMENLVYQSSRTSFFLLYIISVPIIFNIDLVLNTWLTIVPEYSAAFCKLLIWYSYIEALSMPLVIAIMATGKNKYYQIFVSIVISLNLFLTYAFFKLDYPPIFIFYIKFILAFFTLGVRLFFARKQVEISPILFLKKSFMPCFYIVIVTLPIQLFVFEPMYENVNLIYKILFTCILELLLLISIYFIGFNSNERKFINTFALKILKIKK